MGGHIWNSGATTGGGSGAVRIPVLLLLLPFLQCKDFFNVFVNRMEADLEIY